MSILDTVVVLLDHHSRLAGGDTENSLESEERLLDVPIRMLSDINQQVRGGREGGGEGGRGEGKKEGGREGGREGREEEVLFSHFSGEEVESELCGGTAGRGEGEQR